MQRLRKEVDEYEQELGNVKNQVRLHWLASRVRMYIYLQLVGPLGMWGIAIPPPFHVHPLTTMCAMYAMYVR